MQVTKVYSKTGGKAVAQGKASRPSPPFVAVRSGGPKRVLFFGSIWPKPHVSAAGVRSVGLMMQFQSWGWDTTWACGERLSALPKWLTAVESGGFSASTFRSVPLDSNLANSLLLEYQPDVVVFDSFFAEEQWSWRVAERCPGAVRVTDAQDFHSLRFTRQLLASQGKSLEEIIEAKFDWRSPHLLREIAAFHRSDLVILVSPHEMGLLSNPVFGFPAEKFVLGPFFYGGDIFDSVVPSLDARLAQAGNDNVVMLGHMTYKPNVDAVKWAKAEIWPAVRRALPKAELHVYGANITKDITELTSREEGFVVRGALGDGPGALYRSLARYRVHLAPLRFGAGIKGKIVDNWIAGVPTVTTPIGKEGLESAVGTPWGGFGDSTTAKDLADKVVELYKDYPKWFTAMKNGRSIVQERFTAQVAGPVLREAVERTLAAAPTRRTSAEGFFSNLLAASNPFPYLAKYIITKNQNKKPSVDPTQ